jgi:hypothetical protein
MADVMRIGLILTATDRMSRVINHATAKLQQLEKMKNKFAAAGATGAALTGASALIVKTSLDAAGQVEKYKAVLKTMLGSTEAAEKRFEEMSNFAIKTPFELSEVVEMGNQLQAIGMYSKDAMTMIGDLAAASNKPVDQVVRAVAKLKSGQKGVAIDMFRDLLIANDDWVKATGKGVSKTGEMLASTDELLAALPKIMNAKRFSGMMDNLNATYEGQLSNMADANYRLKASFGAMWMPIAMKVIPAITNMLAKFQQWGSKHKWLITGVIGLVGGLGSLLLLISGIGFGAIGFVKGIIFMQKAMGAMRFMAFALKYNLWQAGTAIKSWGVWSKVAAAWQWVLNTSLYGCPIVWIIAGVMAVIAAVVLIVKYWKPITAFFKKLWDGIKQVFVRVWNWIKEMFLKFTIYGLIIRNWKPITAFFKNLWEGIKHVFVKVWNWIKEMFFKFTILGILIRNWSKIGGWFKGLWIKFKEWGAGLIKGLVNGIMSMITAPLKAITKLGSVIKDKFKSIFKINSPSKVFAEYGLNITAGLTNGIESGKDSSVSALKSMANESISAVSNSSSYNGSTMNFNYVVNIGSGAASEKESFAKMLRDHKKDIININKEHQSNIARISYQ